MCARLLDLLVLACFSYSGCQVTVNGWRQDWEKESVCVRGEDCRLIVMASWSTSGGMSHVWG